MELRGNSEEGLLYICDKEDYINFFERFNS